MKRRHRLAEVLLDLLPYEGNPHETACRLEHAIDDDMEVALSRLITEQTLDPSGRVIPEPTADIAARLHDASATCALEKWMWEHRVDCRCFSCLLRKSKP